MSHSPSLGQWNKVNKRKCYTISSTNPSVIYASFLHSFLQTMPRRLSSRRGKNQNLEISSQNTMRK